MAKIKIKFKPPVRNYPVLLSIGTSEDGTIIRLRFDIGMSDPTGKHSQFSYSINGSPDTFTAAALAASDNKIIELTCNTTIAAGEEILLSYAGNITSESGGSMYTYSQVPVTNYAYAGSIPFYSNWDLIINPADASTLDVDGSDNITRIRSAAASPRYFNAQSTGYAVYDSVNNLIVTENSVTNEYKADRAYQSPYSDICFAIKFKAPPAVGTGVTDPMYLLRHSAIGFNQRLNWNASAGPVEDQGRRNYNCFLTADWFATGVTSTSPVKNDEGDYYVVFTSNGTTHKLWINGTEYTAQSAAAFTNTMQQFNRLLHANVATRAAYGLYFLAVGYYLSDSDVSTLNTYLNGL